ncbi:hypothetical protein EWI07_07790 [Sporolactobacillus sp. THM7-4]|nr:hypothetical protein EWI07_07790 [Sporolactobacillus sp. THM7-4]
MMQLLMAGLLLLSQPVTYPDCLIITRQGQTIATVNRTNFTTPSPFFPIIDDKKLKQLIHSLDQKIYQAPVNATISDQGSIVPERIGHRLNKDLFKDQFYRYFYGNGSTKIEAPELNIHPDIDSELLAHIRVRQIGHYVTHFNSGNKNRSHNISLAAEAINNQVIFPNETFSFNRSVGKRTKAKGYLRAKIIVKGEFAEDIGGGICQVSSTLYNAVDRAGLRIVERFSHSRHVPYVPPGRDATVSWYGPDFRFQNQYNQPILIRAKEYGGSLAVTLYSSDVINIQSRKIPNASTGLPAEIDKIVQIDRP